MRTIQLYATGSSTANAVAQITIPSQARIKAAQVSLSVDSITDGAAVKLEFSKIPTTQIDTNGAQDPFLGLRVFGNFVTSGLAQMGVNHTFPLDVECRQGEIIYVHTEVAGTVVYDLNVIFHY